MSKKLKKEMRFLTGDVSHWDHGATFLAKESINVGGVEVFVFVRVGSEQENYWENTALYSYEIGLVSPLMVDSEALYQAALSMRGLSFDEYNRLPDEARLDVIIESLIAYGTYTIIKRVVLWLDMDENDRELAELEIRALADVEGLTVEDILYEMDMTLKNGLGATGRDMMSGNIMPWITGRRDGE